MAGVAECKQLCCRYSNPLWQKQNAQCSIYVLRDISRIYIWKENEWTKDTLRRPIGLPLTSCLKMQCIRTSHVLHPFLRLDYLS